MDQNKVKAKANEAAGAVRETAGAATGDEELEANGRLQKAQAQGTPQKLTASAKQKVSDLKHTIAK